MIYAIETTGFGKRTRYATEAACWAAAELLGFKITAVGDIWQLLHAVREAVQP